MSDFEVCQIGTQARLAQVEAQRDALRAALENAVDCWQTEGLLTDGHVQAMLAAIAKAEGGGNG